MHHEGFCIRPPSEAQSILLQVTLGCSHHRCTFCGSYQDKRFAIKDDAIILEDILYASRFMRDCHRLFLMDGDALIIPQSRLVWILSQIQEHLPFVKRVGSYANAKAIRRKSLADLKELKALGLGILYVGVESGDDRVLERVNKKTSAAELTELAARVKEAGIKLSVTVLLGLAGVDGSMAHARATGALLSAMDPDYVGALTVMLIPGTPLEEARQAGAFQLPDKLGLLRELREMLAHTHLSRGLFFSNHASNYLPIRARLPRGKAEALALIDGALEGRIRLKPEWLRAL